MVAPTAVIEVEAGTPYGFETSNESPVKNRTTTLATG
jgi:hypothetical protein